MPWHIREVTCDNLHLHASTQIFRSTVFLYCGFYTAVKEWDNGYLVVMAKYKHNEKPEEEYIDLVPILQNLYFDVDKFLNPIKSVEVANG